MYLLNFLSRPTSLLLHRLWVQAARHPNTSKGFTLVETMTCLGLAMVLLGLALPSARVWQELLRIEGIQNQLFNDLQLARVRAMQWRQPLRLSPLSGCQKVNLPANDWSCGWQLSTQSTDNTVISTTALDASLQVTFAKTTPFYISARGDLGTIGDRWSVLSRATGLRLVRSLCINSAGRIRGVEGATCS